MTAETADCFETGMIQLLMTLISKELDSIEIDFETKLLTNYRWRAHIFTLQVFRDLMEEKQQQWDYKHNPSVILEQKREFYISEIKARLKMGFNAAADGNIVAGIIDQATRSLAISEVENERKDRVLNQPWTCSSDTVRLKYFEELVREIQSGKKERALKHFLKPATEIEAWYKHQVDAYSIPHARERYIEVWNRYHNNICTHISARSACTSDMDEIEKFVKNYVNQTNVSFPSQLDIAAHKGEDALRFKEHLLLAMRNTTGNDSCSAVDASRPPSKDDIVMSRLGCTKSCYWCKALCWCTFKHDMQILGTPVAQHVTCHQPRGLGRIIIRRYYDTNELNAQCCNDIDDKRLVSF